MNLQTYFHIISHSTRSQVIGWPVLYHQEAADLGVKWPRGVLLHGPSGTGKTSAVYAVASEFNAIVHLVTAGSIIGAFVGESERKLREIFATAARDAEESGAPVVLFLDDVDSLCPRRGPGQQHEARLVGQLLTLLDGASSSNNNSSLNTTTKVVNSSISTSISSRHLHIPGHVVVIAATSRPNALDPALRRPGRLDREVAVPIPSPHARAQILSSLASKLPLDPGNIDLNLISSQCHGYTGADLEALCREAAMEVISEQILAEIDIEQQEQADLLKNTATSRSNSGSAAGENGGGSNTNEINNNIETKDKILKRITTEDFLQAIHRVGASIARTVVKEFPPAKWADIGGLEETKKKLKQAVEWPITKADAFKRLGIRSPRGVLLHGPPGCAKTTLARAAATASGATFIPLQGASLYSMYVGEGEAELREAFRKARFAAPSIIFVDELDMLVGKRGSSGSGENSSDNTSGRLLSTFLNEMDGLELAGGILVLATTNRPGSIDSALLRPGRFDLTVYVPPPDLAGRVAALKIHSKRIPLASDVDVDSIAARTENYTGAELEAVCREAAMAALREDVENASQVAMRHFEAAVRGVVPMLSTEMLEMYASWPPRRK
jgi:SpoVK/Ycf46/Vps4 family AAA+-type ATPase